MELTEAQHEAHTELINIGYGIPDQLPPRGPRFTFDEQCRIL